PGLAPSRAGLARLATPTFAVEAAGTARLATARGRRAALARPRRAAARGSGYPGQGSLLDVNDGRIPPLHQEGSFLATPSKRAEVELREVFSISEPHGRVLTPVSRPFQCQITTENLP